MIRTAVTSLVMFSGSMALYLLDVRWSVPHRIDDLIRSVVMVQAGAAFGMMAYIVRDVSCVRVDSRDRVIKSIRWIAVFIFMATLFIGLDVLSMFGLGYITWKGPVALALFVAGDIGLWQLSREVSAYASAAICDDAVVKVAVLDTGKTGTEKSLSIPADLKG